MSQRNFRFLVIDDDPGDVVILRRLIESIEDWQVELDVCHRTEELAGFVHGQRPDAVFLDYRLGEETGLEVLKLINEVLPGTPVLVLTGHGDEKIAVELMKAGAADYFPKSALSQGVLRRATINAVDKWKLKNKVEEFQRNLATTNRQLARRNEEIRQFYHVVSHELKTPLTSAREFVSIILDGLAGPITDTTREYLELSKDGCDQIARHLNDLLDMSRLETQKMSVNIESQQPENVVSKSVRGMQSAARRKNIALSKTIADELPPILCDESRTRQVLDNLLTNAIKFTPEGGSIEIRAQRDSEGNSIRFSVKDSGVGMDPEHHARIFDRHYQVREEDHSVVGGLGIGLNVCKQLVELQHGRIWVESKVGDGSAFHFTLPVSLPENSQNKGGPELVKELAK